MEFRCLPLEPKLALPRAYFDQWNLVDVLLYKFWIWALTGISLLPLLIEMLALGVQVSRKEAQPSHLAIATTWLSLPWFQMCDLGALN